MAKSISETFIVNWKNETKMFTNKEEAKAFYTENIKEHPETVLRKTIIKIEELTYNGNGVWL